MSFFACVLSFPAGRVRSCLPIYLEQCHDKWSGSLGVILTDTLVNIIYIATIPIGMAPQAGYGIALYECPQAAVLLFQKVVFYTYQCFLRYVAVGRWQISFIDSLCVSIEEHRIDRRLLIVLLPARLIEHLPP